jgi:hypothetical protein
MERDKIWKAVSDIMIDHGDGSTDGSIEITDFIIKTVNTAVNEEVEEIRDYLISEDFELLAERI